MASLRQIQTCKWTGTVLAVLLLSAAIGRWNAFRTAPSGASYAAILVALTLFLLLMLTLAVVVYAEERAKGRLNRPRPFFERWSNRLFPSSDASSR